MSTEVSSRPVKVSDADFEQIVLQSELPVLVDFWAEWCGPCKIIGPTIEELAAAYEGRLKVAKVDVDENQQTALRFGVRSIPTLMIFKDGEAAETAVGVRPKAQLTEIVDRYLA